MQYQRFFSLFDTFSHLTNSKKKAFSVEFLYHKDSNMFPPPNKVKLDTVTSEEMEVNVKSVWSKCAKFEN